VIIRITDDFDPDRIAQSGQCFRWKKKEGETWRIIAGGACLYLTPLGDDLYEFDCTEDEYENFWRQYFDLQVNYQNIRERINREEDLFLWQAAEQEKGIRILRGHYGECDHCIGRHISRSAGDLDIRRSGFKPGDNPYQRCRLYERQQFSALHRGWNAV
jgi:hypothetical protein